jgi:glutamate-1-semialdehyde 2,1-aminomutase
LKAKLEQTILKHNLENFLKWTGYPCLLALVCRNHDGNIDDSFRTLMMQEMIARGVLFQGLFYTTWSHQQAELDLFLIAFDQSCKVYKQAIEQGGVNHLLIGETVKAVFRKKI